MRLRLRDLLFTTKRLGEVEQAAARTFVESVVRPNKIERLLPCKQLTTELVFPASLARSVFRKPFVEVADRDLERLGQLPQSSGRDTIRTTLILLNLLAADSTRNRELLLSQTQQTTTAANTLPQMQVNPCAFRAHNPFPYKPKR